MGVIHWRLKNIFLLIIFISVILCVYKLHGIVTWESFQGLIYSENEKVPCNKYINYVDSKKKWPVITLFGPPGSGVLWLRYLIEQLAGLYTGSATTQYSHLFSAEGKTKNVVIVMSHEVPSIRRMTAGIVVYRNMQDTVRSRFALKHGPGALLEAPMEAYYGKDWENFASSEAKLWAQRYQEYIKTKLPLLVINYDELEEPEPLKKQLLHISHFLHVPIRQSVLDCLVERGSDSDMHNEYKPKPLRFGFHPFELLPQAKQDRLQHYENYTENMVAKARDGFVPRIHI